MKRLLLLCACAAPVQAQRVVPSLSAESGMYAEAYDISNRTARRPAQSVRFYTSPTLSWMGLEIGTMLMWTSDNEFTAQTMNRYYVNPRWSWGQLHGGDYTPVVSRFTASASRIRGGGLELTPGRFRIVATGGLAQDATDFSAFDAAPRRVMYSGLVGYGDPNASFIEISALRAVDDTTGSDSLTVAPQENVVASLAAGLSFRRLRLKGEVGGSLFSRDTRASELDSASTPSMGQGVFTPRLSSRFDQVYSVEARVALPNGSIGVQMEEIGPGFTSLGNPFMATDARDIRLLGSLRMFGGRFAGTASVGTRRDNLAGDKRGTTTRRTGSFAATLVSGQWLVSNVSLLLNGLTRNPTPLPPGTPDPGIVDSFRLRNLTSAIALVEQVRFVAGVPQTVTLSASRQQVDDASPRFGELLDATSTSIVADWSATLMERYVVTLQPGYERFVGAQRDDAFTSMGLGLSRRAPRSRWSASVLATRTQVDDGAQWRASASSGIRLTSQDQVSLTLRHSRLQGVAQPFEETMASMRLTRRW